LELRLLASTGIVGLLLFTGVLVAAVALALRARRHGGLQTVVAGAALMPLIVWLVQGSIDWFWEFPALSGPALGFLGVGCALAGSPVTGSSAPGAVRTVHRRPLARAAISWAAGGAFAVAACLVLAFPYLSVREVSIATNLEGSDPASALQHLRTAEQLNPLDSDPGRLAGSIALISGDPHTALISYQRSIRREPGGWFSWLGAGLASSALHRPRQAHRELEVARHINSNEPAIDDALARVYSRHPLTPVQDFRLLPAIQ
jgi:hypothetical protein